ncbi:MAG: hypothetical protein M3428_01975, partial [Pseudomonadota bacterium]|nr:hypothetical protein [Pseudomonadota bacterium]
MDDYSAFEKMAPRPAYAREQAGPLVALSANSAWNVLNFRRSLIAALQSDGYRVVVIVPAGDDVEDLRKTGIAVATLPMKPRGVSPPADALLTWRYLKLLRRLQPAAYLGFTAKPNIYGSMAANLCGIPVINNITGLGTAFGPSKWLTRVISLLYRLALARALAPSSRIRVTRGCSSRAAWCAAARWDIARLGYRPGAICPG